MQLLEQGRPAADRWLRVADAAPIPDDVAALIGLERLAEVPAGRTAPLGVVVGPATLPEELAPLLNRVALIAVAFPKFRDGRGFTLGRALRERFRYGGELRAVGHVLPDQHLFLLRCGFSAVEVADGADLAPWTAALGRFHTAYQAMVTDKATLRQCMRRFG